MAVPLPAVNWMPAQLLALMAEVGAGLSVLLLAVNCMPAQLLALAWAARWRPRGAAAHPLRLRPCSAAAQRAAAVP